MDEQKSLDSPGPRGRALDATLGGTKRGLCAPRVCGRLCPPHLGSSRKASTLMNPCSLDLDLQNGAAFIQAEAAPA
jgi:hypothetical protein